MTKKEFAQEVSRHCGVDIIETEKVLSSLGDILPEILKQGEQVFIRGFGTIKTVTRKARPVRNITAGTTIWMDEFEKPVVKFGGEFLQKMK